MKPILFIRKSRWQYYIKRDYTLSSKFRITMKNYDDKGICYGTFHDGRSKDLAKKIKLLKKKIR